MEGRQACDDALWQRLAAYEIGPPDAALSFAARLARENRWSADYAERVIGEYKRFCYLASVAGHQVTPSDQVDQAWHLHLTYSRDYWERFCREVLGRPLHHGPTRGGRDEGERFYDQYAQTLASYEQAFGKPPPEDIWSPAQLRFEIHPQAFRVHVDRLVVFPAQRGLAALVAVAILLVAMGVVLGRML